VKEGGRKGDEDVEVRHLVNEERRRERRETKKEREK